MKIFKQSKNQLSLLPQNKFKLEKDLQKLFEENLSVLTQYQFIKSEFTIKNNRIDTLAFDPESRAFIIIEYKRRQNESVIDQGISYLNLMLEYKADFIVEYNESQKNTLKRDEVDWSQSKVIFVSPSFNEFQIQASNFKDLPIELWEVNRFEQDIIVVNVINKSKSAPSIRQIRTTDDQKLEKALKEIKVYSEDEHLQNGSDKIKELYETLKEAILKLDPSLIIEAKKVYLAFKKDRNVVDILIQNKQIKMWINLPKGKLDDPKKLASDVSEKGHWGNGDYELIIQDDKHLEYIMSLVKQAI